MTVEYTITIMLHDTYMYMYILFTLNYVHILQASQYDYLLTDTIIYSHTINYKAYRKHTM